MCDIRVGIMSKTFLNSFDKNNEHSVLKVNHQIVPSMQLIIILIYDKSNKMIIEP